MEYIIEKSVIYDGYGKVTKTEYRIKHEEVLLWGWWRIWHYATKKVANYDGELYNRVIVFDHLAAAKHHIKTVLCGGAPQDKTVVSDLEVMDCE